MHLIINGERREFAEEITLADLIKLLELSSERVAVELNLNVIRRADWINISLKDGDKLEIIHFVGGG